jgi:hypothetical protein
LHVSPRNSVEDLHQYLATDFQSLLAQADGILKLRLHLCSPFINDDAHPPAPNVRHTATGARQELAMIELAFENPVARRRFFSSRQFAESLPEQSAHIAQLKAFAVSGVYTYVSDGLLTTAGLRGSRAAELIEYLGAVNQLSPDVEQLLLKGTITPGSSAA